MGKRFKSLTFCLFISFSLFISISHQTLARRIKSDISWDLIPGTCIEVIGPQKLPSSQRPLLVIFDVHGTLLQPTWQQEYIRTYELCTGRSDGKEWVESNTWGKEREEVLQLISEISGKSIVEVRRIFHEVYRSYRVDGAPELIPGVLNFIKSLAEEGVPIIAVSGSPRDVVLSQLYKAGLLDYIDPEYVVSEQGLKGRSRVDRANIIQALRKLFPDFTFLYFADWISSSEMKKIAQEDENFIIFGLPQGECSSQPWLENRKALIEVGANYILRGWADYPYLLTLAKMGEKENLNLKWSLQEHIKEVLLSFSQKKPPIWSKESFLEALAKVAARLGTTSTAVFLKDPEGRMVYHVFYNNKEKWGFRSWAEAVEAAGLEHDVKRGFSPKWTKEVFLEKLREIAQRLGTTSTSAFLEDPEGRKIYCAFHNYKEKWGFESWAEAVEAAGLKHDVKRSFSPGWTKEVFLEKLREIAQRLGTTSTSAFLEDPEGRKVYSVFQYHKQEWGFESWTEAVEAAGLEHNVRRGPPENWTREMFLAELRRIAEKLGTPASLFFRRDPQGRKVWEVFQSRGEEWGFLSWNHAVRAAGIEIKTPPAISESPPEKSEKEEPPNIVRPTQLETEDYPCYAAYWATALVIAIAQQLDCFQPSRDFTPAKLQELIWQDISTLGRLGEVAKALESIKTVQGDREWESLAYTVLPKILSYLAMRGIMKISGQNLKRLQPEFVRLLPHIVVLLKDHLPGELLSPLELRVKDLNLFEAKL